MDIALSIGNTNTRVSLITKRRILKTGRFQTARIAENLKSFLQPAADRVFIASVVPEATRQAIKAAGGRKARVITCRDVPLILKVREPEKTGIDRLLNCFAAWEIYRRECLVVDAGSAITIDFVNKNRVFEGGVIFPGIRLLEESLKTLALLKKSRKTAIAPLLGKDTDEAISSGILNGLPFLLLGYYRNLNKKYPSLKLVFTGGDGVLLQSRLGIGTYNENLIFHGIRTIASNCLPD